MIFWERFYPPFATLHQGKNSNGGLQEREETRDRTGMGVAGIAVSNEERTHCSIDGQKRLWGISGM